MGEAMIAALLAWWRKQQSYRDLSRLEALRILPETQK